MRIKLEDGKTVHLAEKTRYQVKWTRQDGSKDRLTFTFRDNAVAFAQDMRELGSTATFHSIPKRPSFNPAE